MKHLKLFLVALMGYLPFGFSQNIPDLMPIGTYRTGIFNGSAAEIAAYDQGTFRLFFTNGGNNQLEVLDISDPTAPAFIQAIDLSVYGGGVNSVAVYNGLVAVAIENQEKTSPGSVVFLNADGMLQGTVEVGALPDMLTFTPDGTKVLVANEGEPNDDYSIDPEGTISIIDLSSGAGAATVTTIDFNGYNDQLAHLQNKGLRIFGPGASVAQDVEPEYIAVSKDGQYAYVALQENNGLAVIDLDTQSLLDIFPLGYKDHLRGRPSLDTYVLNELVSDWPVLGTPVYDGGQPDVFLGGFSGLYYDEGASTSESLVFYTVPDRGPNDAAVSKDEIDQQGLPENLRPFKLPDYQARMVKFTLNVSSGTVTLDDQILLQRQEFNPVDSMVVDTVPITGKGNVIAFDEVPVTYTDLNTAYRNSDYTLGEEAYHEVTYDPYGGDFEGIVKDREGFFWLCDENRPALYKFDANGLLHHRYVPDGTSDLGIIPLEIGFYGEETLPRVYRKRRTNRGFEAIAYDSLNHIIYAFIQSPMDVPDSGVRNQSDIIRILGVDASNGIPVEEYVYLLERNRNAGFALSRTDKIGDAVYTGNGKFLVIERDSSTPDDGDFGHKYIFEMDLKGATNIIDLPVASNSLSDGPDDLTLEQLTAEMLDSMGIQPVYKQKVLNLPSIGYLPSDKVEGISLLPNGQVAVLNDNDFGLAGSGMTDNNTLGIINFERDAGLDPSDRDNGVNINSYPVLGMYQPDAITSFEHNGQHYILTANEGDAREYEGESNTYVEEDRIAGLDLDPAVFPNAANLQSVDQIGRLKATTSQGDIDADGLYDRLFTFGARSFSIWDAFGNLVFDSGEEFEQQIAAEIAKDFNSNNDENGSFDSRSDDKGPEPEAIAVIGGTDQRIALIGLERVGGIMVYDITDPKAPMFLDYVNNRNFDVMAMSDEAGDLGVEDIKFVGGEDSPTGNALVITANETSGTITIFQLDGIVDVKDFGKGLTSFSVFPNPADQRVYTGQVSDYQLYNAVGQPVGGVQKETDQINIATLSSGMYFVVDRLQLRMSKFLKH